MRMLELWGDERFRGLTPEAVEALERLAREYRARGIRTVSRAKLLNDLARMLAKPRKSNARTGR